MYVHVIMLCSNPDSRLGIDVMIGSLSNVILF